MPKIAPSKPFFLSVDTETTGVDRHHGAQPYLVTTCDETGMQLFWEWPVNPLTREPIIPDRDVRDIRRLIMEGIRPDGTRLCEGLPTLILQNTKFDVLMLTDIIPDLIWPWERTHNTLAASHVLASGTPHNLTYLVGHYLGWPIQQYEDAMEKACKDARAYCRRNLKEWMIAKEGLDCMPSAKASGKGEKDKLWKYDTWLPRMVAVGAEYPVPEAECAHEWNDKFVCRVCRGHSWHIVSSIYANVDSETTVSLWPVMEEKLQERGLYEIYLARLNMDKVATGMEQRGITLSSQRLERLYNKFAGGSKDCEAICRNIAQTYGTTLIMPKSGNSKSLTTFIFKTMKVPVVDRSEKTGEPSLDKDVLDHLTKTLPIRSMPLTFAKRLQDKRNQDTAITYMNGYRKYWIPVLEEHGLSMGVYRLYPNLNPYGTRTLRWGCTNPNEQNISKREGFNLREAFGPAPGRVWWSMDAKNIERRIPAYEAMEDAIVSLFERPDDAPYFGSEHSLVASLLHPEMFAQCQSCRICRKEVWCKASSTKREECCRCQTPMPMVDGRVFKKRYAAMWYQWVKNGNFSIQYGAGKRKADATYHVDGAFDILKSRFHKQEELNQRCIWFAQKNGYIETLPDRTVNPERGYPLMCMFGEYGRVKPTIPLNYHTSGTAMWWMQQAMTRCEAQLEQWRREDGFTGFITMQVHDELIFDFPADSIHPLDDNGRDSNKWRIKILKGLMEQGGRDLVVPHLPDGIPTPCNVEYHEDNWAEGVSIAC